MSYVLHFLSKSVDIFGEEGGVVVVSDFLVSCLGLTILNVHIRLCLQLLCSWIPGLGHGL